MCFVWIQLYSNKKNCSKGSKMWNQIQLKYKVLQKKTLSNKLQDLLM